MICWDKCQPEGLDQAMCEFAWTSIDKTAKIIKTSIQQIQFTRTHPTEKPTKLYKWLLKMYATEGMKILDTHLGSGSIAIACHDYGFDLTACELDKEYYDKAMQRINNHISQQKLF
jgi:site-specific DNA-methyltransferase (adenine-specific)